MLFAALARAPAVLAYGSAILVGVLVARLFTLTSVTRTRRAGFEMAWRHDGRSITTTRLSPAVLVVELRNRDALPAHFAGLNVVASPGLSVEPSVVTGAIPARGRLLVSLTITPLSVGRHGIFSLGLHTIVAPGLHTVPLGFSSPFVLDVLPARRRSKTKRRKADSAALSAPSGKRARGVDSGTEPREIRDHRPGDPFRNIAWKASARRGRLLTIDRESEDRRVAWVLVDASVDAHAGAVGSTALEGAIEEGAALATTYLDRGDSVGLTLFGARTLAELAPRRGPEQAAELLKLLAFASHTADADRSEWDRSDVEARVLEHARSLDPRALSIRPGDVGALATLAAELASRAPLAPLQKPHAPSEAERILRGYLLAFGVQPPPRGASERARAEAELVRLLGRLPTLRRRPTTVHVLSPMLLAPSPTLVAALNQLERRRVDVRLHAALERLPGESRDSVRASVARDALRLRQAAQLARSRRELASGGLTLGPLE